MLVFVVAGTVLVDLALGSAAALAGLRLGVRKYSDYFRRPHPVLHHGFQPSVSYSGALWGPIRYEVHTNSLGFKDRRVRDVALRSDKKRVLFVGDSFTEGIGIEYGKTFVGLVDAHLAKRGVEVLNGGVYSYAPLLYLRLVQHLFEDVGLVVDHVCVFIDYSDVNDEANLYEFDADRNVVSPLDREFARRFKRFLDDNTILIKSVRTLVRNIKRQLDPPDTSWRRALDKTAWSYDEAVFDEWGRKGLDRATRHMTELAAYLANKKIPLTIGIYPWPDQIMQRDADNRHRVHWKRWAGERGLEVVDCFPAFLDGGEPEHVIREHFIAGDFHWNERGHAVMAKAVIDWFDRRSK